MIIGNKPIIEYGIDHLIQYGIENITISINYLGEQIEEYFQNGAQKGISIKYVTEKEKMGTLGSISLIEHFEHDDVLIMNFTIN